MKRTNSIYDNLWFIEYEIESRDNIGKKSTTGGEITNIGGDHFYPWVFLQKENSFQSNFHWLGHP